jgi:hypothetical protein
MELGCPALPYQPHVFFVNETGAIPRKGMDFDADGGVTILVVLEAYPGYSFSEPIQWAAITDSEFRATNKTFSTLHNEFFTSGFTTSSTGTCKEAWCFVKTGTLNTPGTNVVPIVRVTGSPRTSWTLALDSALLAHPRQTSSG